MGIAAVAAIAVALAISLSGGGSSPTVALPPVIPQPTPTPTPECSTATGVFVPTTVSVPGVGRKISVLPLPRDAHGVPGVPPLTSVGKTEMAFDLGNGVEPGAQKGNALLNAHTWPDGSALGNKLLAGLHLGDPLLVQGRSGGICYHVTGRVEVPATAQHSGYFDTSGPPRIAIAVCSGRRLGPGRWTTRTLWFASPTQPPAPAAPAPKRTDPASDKSGLGLGGLGLSRR